MRDRNKPARDLAAESYKLTAVLGRRPGVIITAFLNPNTRKIETAAQRQGMDKATPEFRAAMYAAAMSMLRDWIVEEPEVEAIVTAALAACDQNTEETYRLDRDDHETEGAGEQG